MLPQVLPPTHYAEISRAADVGCTPASAPIGRPVTFFSLKSHFLRICRACLYFSANSGANNPDNSGLIRNWGRLPAELMKNWLETPRLTLTLAFLMFPTPAIQAVFPYINLFTSSHLLR